MIAFVKDEGNNLMFMATTLHSIVDCLKLQLIYKRTCFGHIMSKACQYATNDEKVIASLNTIYVKATQGNLQKTITWTKNQERESRNGKRHVLKGGCGFKNLRPQ